MDMNAETRNVKVWALLGVVFLFSAYASCTEIKYAIWGKTADADIVRTFGLKDGRRVENAILTVEYRFRQQDGTERRESMNMADDWEVPTDNKLKVQYLPGVRLESRLAGERNYIAATICLLCLGGVVLFALVTWRNATRKPRSFDVAQVFRQRPGGSKSK